MGVRCIDKGGVLSVLAKDFVEKDGEGVETFEIGDVVCDEVVSLAFFVVDVG